MFKTVRYHYVKHRWQHSELNHLIALEILFNFSIESKMIEGRNLHKMKFELRSAILRYLCNLRHHVAARTLFKEAIHWCFSSRDLFLKNLFLNAQVHDLEYKLNSWGQRRSLRSPSFYIFTYGYVNEQPLPKIIQNYSMHSQMFQQTKESFTIFFL